MCLPWCKRERSGYIYGMFHNWHSPMCMAASLVAVVEFGGGHVLSTAYWHETSEGVGQWPCTLSAAKNGNWDMGGRGYYLEPCCLQKMVGGDEEIRG